MLILQNFIIINKIKKAREYFSRFLWHILCIKNPCHTHNRCCSSPNLNSNPNCCLKKEQVTEEARSLRLCLGPHHCLM